MKIRCELLSRDTGKTVTTHDLEIVCFGGHIDNPFPCSRLVSVHMSSISSIAAVVSYEVEAA